MIRIKTRDIPIYKKKLLKRQGGRCCLCGRDLSTMELKNVVLDHDHVTGNIRGVLCRLCNGHEGRVKTLATQCAKLTGYQAWVIALGEYYKAKPCKELHPTYRTEREERDLKNKRARAAYAKSKGKRAKPKRKQVYRATKK